MSGTEIRDLLTDLETVALTAGPGGSRELALRCTAALLHLTAVCEDKERRLGGYRRAADEDRAVIASLTAERDKFLKNYEAACGELLVSIDNPDPLVQKLVTANRVLRSQLNKAEQRVCDSRAAAVIDVGRQGGPCRVEPRHVETEIDRLRAEVERLRGRGRVPGTEDITDAMVEKVEDEVGGRGAWDLADPKALVAAAAAAWVGREGGGLSGNIDTSDAAAAARLRAQRDAVIRERNDYLGEWEAVRGTVELVKGERDAARCEADRLRAQRDAAAAVAVGYEQVLSDDYNTGEGHTEAQAVAELTESLKTVDPAEAARLGAVVFPEPEGGG